MGKIQIIKVLKKSLATSLLGICSCSMVGCYDILALDKNSNPPIYENFDVKEVDPNAEVDNDEISSDNSAASLKDSGKDKENKSDETNSNKEAENYVIPDGVLSNDGTNAGNSNG